jgi:hypothetical protein
MYNLVFVLSSRSLFSLGSPSRRSMQNTRYARVVSNPLEQKQYSHTCTPQVCRRPGLSGLDGSWTALAPVGLDHLVSWHFFILSSSIGYASHTTKTCITTLARVTDQFLFLILRYQVSSRNCVSHLCCITRRPAPSSQIH